MKIIRLLILLYKVSASVLAKNKIETIKKIREKGFYATGVHINNNIYSIFGNKTNLSGVNDFMNHFVALPCGWWINMGL